MATIQLSNIYASIINTENKVSEMYHFFSEEVKDIEAKKLFIKMSEDEKKHSAIYAAITNNLPGNEVLEVSDEDAEYLQTLMDLNIFINDIVKERHKKNDALTIAEKVEKDGILFYSELSRLLKDRASKEFSQIIAEEKKHLKYVLEAQKNSFIFALTL
ncbi:ferritin family protein [Clostridium sp. DL1XJH146]